MKAREAGGSDANPQLSIGGGNLINKGGTASATSHTTQIGGNFAGW